MDGGKRREDVEVESGVEGRGSRNGGADYGEQGLRRRHTAATSTMMARAPRAAEREMHGTRIPRDIYSLGWRLGHAHRATAVACSRSGRVNACTQTSGGSRSWQAGPSGGRLAGGLERSRH